MGIVLLILCLSLIGCGKKDLVKEELITFLSIDLNSILDDEKIAVDAYNSASKDLTNQKNLQKSFDDVILPHYKTFLKNLRTITVETDEVKQLHKTYVEGAALQFKALTMIGEALKSQDDKVLKKANEYLDEAQLKLADYNKQLEELTKEHNIKLSTGSESNE